MFLASAWKFRVPGDEIRLRIDLDDDPVDAADKNGDEPLGGDPAGFPGRLGKPLLAQPIDRRFDFAPGFAEGILAIHHAGAGLLAKILHHRGGDVRHIAFSFIFYEINAECPMNRPHDGRSDSATPTNHPIIRLTHQRSAGDETTREINPAVAFDAAGELQIMIDLGRVFRRHGGDLPIMINPRIIEFLHDLRPDARQFGEIVGGAARRRQEFENAFRRLRAGNSGSPAPRFRRRTGLPRPARSISPKSTPTEPCACEMPSIAARAARSQ